MDVFGLSGVCVRGYMDEEELHDVLKINRPAGNPLSVSSLASVHNWQIPSSLGRDKVHLIVTPRS